MGDGPSSRPHAVRPQLAVVGSPEAVRRELAVLDERVRRFRARRQARATVAAYRSDWRDFTSWCAAHELTPLPATPATLVWYLVSLADRLAPATIGRRLVAIAAEHRPAGQTSPTIDAGVREVWHGIRRAPGTRPGGVAPLQVADLRTMVAAIGPGEAGTRDRGLLLLGFAGAFRRSELVGLDVADVELTGAGAIVTVRRSKTDQRGEGQQVGIPRGEHPETCPVRALEAWLRVLDDQAGPIFRAVDRHGRVRATRLSGRDVARIVQRRASGAGLEPRRYAGHSLRSGLATSAALAGAPEADLVRHLRHRSPAMTRRYVRHAELFRANPAAIVGL